MTEKQYAPTKTERKMKKKVNTPKAGVLAPKLNEDKEETKEKMEINKEDKKTPEENKTEEIKKTRKPEIKKIKKDLAEVNAKNIPLSTKYAVSICRFIKGKTTGDAIRDLELVLQKKKHIPMKGEYAHRKGEGKIASGAGKYPVEATKKFIMLVKSLASNSIANGMDNPYISEAVANKASAPVGRFGRWERKRTHVKLAAKEKKIREKQTKEEKK